MPDSVLLAAKKFADIAGLSWANVYPVYKALQGEAAPCLPKSSGRQIHLVQPVYIARLLLGVLAWRAGVDPAAANEDFCQATRNGEPLMEDQGSGLQSMRPYLEFVIARILSEDRLVRGARSITFMPGQACVRIEHTDPEIAGEYWPQDELIRFKWADSAGLISSSATASAIFASLKCRIDWAMPHQFMKTRDDEEVADA